VALARKAGSKWYIACINGENAERSIDLNLSSFTKQKGLLITDGAEPLTFKTENTDPGFRDKVVLKPNGGLVIVLE